MIVCVCNAIREHEIQEAAGRGLYDVEHIYADLGCEPNCCQCLAFAESIVKDVCEGPLKRAA